MNDVATGARRRSVWPAVIIAALVAFAMLGMGDWADLWTGDLADADDHLRIVQIRDLLAGQPWFDTVQHRINPPFGGQSHWSRFIDAPVGALVTLCQALLGPQVGERVAMLTWPFLLLIATFFALDRVLRRVGDDWVRWVGLGVASISWLAIFQYLPFRIDHHSAQQLCFAIAFACIVGRRDQRSAALAGVAMAMQASISIEGLAHIIIVGALFGARWLMTGREGERLRANVWATTAALFAFTLISRGPGVVLASQCDAISAPYLALMAALSVLLWPTMRLAEQRPGLLPRLAALGVSGAVAVGAMGLVEPLCYAGPFAALPPYVRQFWYNNVLEGLPVWQQPRDALAIIVVPPLVGLIATARSYLRARGSQMERTWFELLFLAIACTMLGVLVMRAMNIAMFVVMPGVACTIVDLWRASRGQSNSARRVIGVIPALLFVPPVAASIAELPLRNAAAVTEEPDSSSCTIAAVRGLLAPLDDALVFTQIDIAPMVLAVSDVKVVATGHHRNAAAMERVMRAFMSDAATARSQVGDAPYLLFCPGLPEPRNYREHSSRDSLVWRLSSGRPPEWLERVNAPTPGGPQLYRVLPAR